MSMHFRAVKLRRLRWAGHVPQMGKTTNAYINFGGKPLGSCHLEHWQYGTRRGFGAMAGFAAVALKFRALTVTEIALRNKESYKH